MVTAWSGRGCRRASSQRQEFTPSTEARESNHVSGSASAEAGQETRQRFQGKRDRAGWIHCSASPTLHTEEKGALTALAFAEMPKRLVSASSPCSSAAVNLAAPVPCY